MLAIYYILPRFYSFAFEFYSTEFHDTNIFHLRKNDENYSRPRNFSRRMMNRKRNGLHLLDMAVKYALVLGACMLNPHRRSCAV